MAGVITHSERAAVWIRGVSHFLKTNTGRRAGAAIRPEGKISSVWRPGSCGRGRIRAEIAADHVPKLRNGNGRVNIVDEAVDGDSVLVVREIFRRVLREQRHPVEQGVERADADDA